MKIKCESATTTAQSCSNNAIAQMEYHQYRGGHVRIKLCAVHLMACIAERFRNDPPGLNDKLVIERLK